MSTRSGLEAVHHGARQAFGVGGARCPEVERLRRRAVPGRGEALPGDRTAGRLLPGPRRGVDSGPMEYRQLGRSGLRVSALTLGTMTFGGKGSFAAVGSTD